MRSRTRRSIAFQLWIRISAITVAFTLVALTFYVWLELSDNVNSAHDQAVLRANAVASAITRLTETGNPPGVAEMSVAQTLGVQAVQILGPDGQVIATLGDLNGESALVPAEVENKRLVPEQGYEVHLTNGGFTRKDIGALDLLRGGDYGSVFVYPAAQGGAPGGIRLVVAYAGISNEAQTLLVRTTLLTGAILAVAVFAMWLLLNRFVAKPLQNYARTALRIATGEPLRMPDLGNNELGQLGQAINGMAEILRHEATVDPLTGLFNLRHLSDRLEDLITDASRSQEPLALLVCDLDNLKPVNDTYGHQAGDQLLKAVAHHLLVWAGIDYTCWRTGGDEFAAVIPNLDPEQASRELAALERAINATTLSVPGGEVTISMSIGLANYPADGTTGAALMNIADMRMYESKSHKTKPAKHTSVAS